MNAKLLKAYREARAEFCAWYPNAATNALRVARERLRLESLARALSFPSYLDAREIVELPGGARFVITCEHDSGATFSDSFMCRVDWLRHEPYQRTGDIFYHAPDWWIDRDGRAYVRGDRRGERAIITTDCSMPERVASNRKYLARHAAHVQARADLAREFDCMREYWTGAESFVCVSVELRSRDGETIADESCGGITTGDDYARDCAMDQCAYMLRKYAERLRADMEGARANMRDKRQRVARLASELRALRNVDAPNACAVLRESLAAMRAAVRDSVRTLRESREALAALGEMHA